MKSGQDVPKDIDSYIAEFSPEIQATLQKLRATIQKAAPDATEAIKYGMPTFVMKGNLVHFAAQQKHIGFYPGSSGIAQFQAELGEHVTGKGTAQFTYGAPIPYALITKIVKFCVKENQEIAEARAKKK